VDKAELRDSQLAVVLLAVLLLALLSLTLLFALATQTKNQPGTRFVCMFY